MMRALRIFLALGTVTILCPLAAQAVDGVNEISQTSILAAGGFPYTIPAPGSYVLTSDLAPPLGVGALSAGADNIEINLNGFTIVSPGGGGTGIDSAGFSGLTVRRGVVQGFGGAGIVPGTNSKVFEMKVTGNGLGVIGGFQCLVVMSVVTGNLGDGIRGDSCKFENNVAQGNSGIGMAGMGTVMIHNRIGGNTGGGILAFGGDKIQENVIQMNSGFGIADVPPPGPPPPVPPPAGPPPRNSIIGNVIDGTLGGPGISLFLPALISQNSVTANFADGILCGAACVVNDNDVSSNNTGGLAASGGVTVAAGSVVHANTISFNTGFGLTLPFPASASYTNNTITGNAPGPNVISPATITGGFGNVCFPAACP
jgi:hypothetical protein